jgi:hypothetical protein
VIGCSPIIEVTLSISSYRRTMIDFIQRVIGYLPITLLA